MRTDIVNIFWEKEQQFAKEKYGNELLFFEEVLKHGNSTRFPVLRKRNSLPHVRFIELFKEFLNDDELFLYTNYWLNKHSEDEEAEDFVSGFLLSLNISQELRHYIRTKRKKQREEMIKAIDEEAK